MGRRGPRPLPANIHILRGNPSKKPLIELIAGVHPVIGIPGCPAHLQEDAKKEWRRVSVELEALGLISKIDRGALTAYCSAWAESVFCEKKIDELNKADPNGVAGLVDITPNGYQQMSVWLQIRNRAYERMMRFASEFGMSPSARSRVSQSVNNGQLQLPGVDAKPDGWATL